MSITSIATLPDVTITTITSGPIITNKLMNVTYATNSAVSGPAGFGTLFAENSTSTINFVVGSNNAQVFYFNSGLTGGGDRTVKIPTGSGSLLTATSTATLTNKTILTANNNFVSARTIDGVSTLGVAPGGGGPTRIWYNDTLKMSSCNQYPLSFWHFTFYYATGTIITPPTAGVDYARTLVLQTATSTDATDVTNPTNTTFSFNSIGIYELNINSQSGTNTNARMFVRDSNNNLICSNASMNNSSLFAQQLNINHLLNVTTTPLVCTVYVNYENNTSGAGGFPASYSTGLGEVYDSMVIRKLN